MTTSNPHPTQEETVKVTLYHTGNNFYEIAIPDTYGDIVSPFKVDSEHFVIGKYKRSEFYFPCVTSAGNNTYFEILGIAHNQDVATLTYELALEYANKLVNDANKPLNIYHKKFGKVRPKWVLEDKVEPDRTDSLEGMVEGGEK